MKPDGRIFKTGKDSVIVVLLFLTVGILTGIIPAVYAEDDFPTTHYWNPYQGWDIDLSSVAGIGLFPTVEVDWTPEPENEDVPKTTTTDTWVKLAFYPPGSEAGQPAILAGYVGGRNYNADVTITGKTEVPDEFHDIVTVKAQENGVFVWAIPDSLKNVKYYQAVAKVSGASAKSEIVATSGISGYVPADSGTATPTIVAVSEPKTNLPVITSLTLSADNMGPEIGESVELSGRLTTDKGKGVSGATISIEVPDYGTDFLPLTTATTDSDGRFYVTIDTWEGGVVPVRAVFEGDETYLESSSNTLTFYAVDKKSDGIF